MLSGSTSSPASNILTEHCVSRQLKSERVRTWKGACLGCDWYSWFTLPALPSTQTAIASTRPQRFFKRHRPAVCVCPTSPQTIRLSALWRGSRRSLKSRSVAPRERCVDFAMDRSGRRKWQRRHPACLSRSPGRQGPIEQPHDHRRQDCGRTPTEVYHEGFIETPDVTVLEKTTTP